MQANCFSLIEEHPIHCRYLHFSLSEVHRLMQEAGQYELRGVRCSGIILSPKCKLHGAVGSDGYERVLLCKCYTSCGVMEGRE